MECKAFPLLLFLGLVANFRLMQVQGKNIIKPLGCFRDSLLEPRPLPELIRNLRNDIDWQDLSKTINACANIAASKGYLYFGVQFYGECWSGPRAHLTYDQDGQSMDCEDGVGKKEANFVYRLSGEEDECFAYNILHSATRSRCYSTTHPPSCDSFNVNNFKKGWYRFQGSAGKIMAGSCVPANHCGTVQSGWFLGDLPEVTDKIQDGKVCFTGTNNQCCDSSVAIRVRNCGYFYVYYLPDSTNGCPKAYCGNGQ